MCSNATNDPNQIPDMIANANPPMTELSIKIAKMIANILTSPERLDWLMQVYPPEVPALFLLFHRSCKS